MSACIRKLNIKGARNFWTRTKVNYGKYQIVEPGKVSPQKTVPDYIPKPSYHMTGIPLEQIDTPEVKTKEQILGMHNACKLAANILNEIERSIKVGQTTDFIDNQVHKLTIQNGAYPSPLNYKHFPKSVCTSVNNVACHGIPDDRPLQDGDIINVDITVFYKGFHGDCSKTFMIGNVDDIGIKLVAATETCLNEAIQICKPGREFWKIGAYIEERAKDLGYDVIPVFTGHGIGNYFHGPPDIFHVENDYPGKMKAGMTFTIEPVLTQGINQIGIMKDNWTAVTLDCARTAQFEHTVLITDTDVKILTLPD